MHTGKTLLTKINSTIIIPLDKTNLRTIYKEIN